jgi:hypothetical protein
MLRRLLPLLIAYLMLMSQQVALSHGYSHWTKDQKAVAGAMFASADTRQGQAQLEHSCLQCLSAAELAFAIAGPVYRFDIATDLPVPRWLRPTLVLERITTIVFQSRAPPVL